MADLILGTAGHIDHGKTTLIKALTGIDTDRLKEEKERGITIELGFSFIKTPENEIIGIVDVPGHEKFIKNMVAGVCGIDVVMLIIAADEGIMPQTIEHVEICNLLGIKRGLVVVTKTDLIDDEIKELLQEEITDFKENNFLKDAPVFFVSSKTGEGIEELKNYIYSLPKSLNDKINNGYFILPIDRVFTMKGFGTIVTGTAMSGTIKVGDEIKILPKNINGKIRNIQVHGNQVEEVSSGHRTAINVQGIAKNEINRGDVLTTTDYFNSTKIVDGKLHYLSSNKKPLKNRLQVKYHSGTNAVPAKIIILDKKEILPGEDAFVQLIFDREIFNIHGDKFIIRSFDDKKTLGGGTVLDGSPEKKKRFKDESINYLNLLESGNLQEKLEILIEKYGKFGIDINKLISKLNIKKDVLLNVLKGLDVILVDNKKNIFINKSNFNLLKNSALEIIKEFHKIHPKQQGIALEELRQRIYPDLNYNLFELILQSLKDDNKIKIKDGLVSLKNFSIKLNSSDEAKKEAVYKLIKNGGTTPPFLNQITKELNLSEKELSDFVNILISEDKIVKIKSDFFIDKEIYNNIKDKVVDFLKNNQEMSLQDFKKLVNVSRKFMIPILEHFDSIKLTVRKGDKRVLRT